MSGVYGGGTISFATSSVTPPLPIGITSRPPIATGPFFDTFIVKKIDETIPVCDTVTLEEPADITVTEEVPYDPCA
jgi:hypothetical protein